MPLERDRVQIDAVYVQIAPECHTKHFTAYCPVAEWTVAKAFRRATAQAAALFRDKVLAETPFPVKAIQVDGGSEFKAEFERACADKKLVLYELPPKSPKLNGGVEGCNAAWRYEFYAVYDLPTGVDAINPHIDSFQHLYNHHRPHGALAGRTPAAYSSTTAAETHAASLCAEPGQRLALSPASAYRRAHSTRGAMPRA